MGCLGRLNGIGIVHDNYWGSRGPANTTPLPLPKTELTRTSEDRSPAVSSTLEQNAPLSTFAFPGAFLSVARHPLGLATAFPPASSCPLAERRVESRTRQPGGVTDWLSSRPQCLEKELNTTFHATEPVFIRMCICFKKKKKRTYPILTEGKRSLGGEAVGNSFVSFPIHENRA